MIINLKNETDLSGFYVVYNGSTNLEKVGNRGISHLMEHLICKNIDHLQDTYEENGISWNAYTSQNNIVFHLTGLDENVNKYKGEFLNLLSDFTTTREQFENERKIVLEEYTDSFNDQSSSHYLNLDRKLYDFYNPIGDRGDLENLKFMDCINFFEKQFLNPSKIINVSKHNEFDKSMKFDNRKISKKYKFISNVGDVNYELNNSFGDKSSLIMKSPIIKDNFAILNLINLMLGSGLNSPLYQEVREKKGLCYYINCYTNRLNDVSDIDITTLTSNSNIDEIIDTVNNIFNNITDHLTKDRFNIIKKSVKINLTKQNINRHSSVNKWISPEEWDLSKIIDKITLDECIDVFSKYYNLDDFYISDDKSEFK